MRTAGKFVTAIATGAVAAGTLVFVEAYRTSKDIEQKLAASKSKPPHIINGKHLVSVVIPALDEEGYLPSLLQSINNQTYVPIEVIVADSSTGESQAKTQEICSQFHAKYVNVPKLNVSLARNKGAEAATGDILCFTDADCIMSNNYIEEMVDALNSGKTLAHGADPYYKDKDFQMWSIIGRSWLKPKTWTTGRGICIWKDAFNKIGGYDISLDPITGVREDLDLGRRVADTYGLDSIALLRNVYIGESTRRIEIWPAPWKSVRGVR